MSEILLADLVTEEDVVTLYQKLIDILESLGVSTSTWKPGDPTRETLYAVATILAAKETLQTSVIKAGFLELAEKKWLSNKGKSDYDVPREEATYAECNFVFTSTAALSYVIDAEDITLRNSSTGATYRNVAAGTLTAGGTLTLLIRAEVAGSSSSAGIGEIDEIVTSMPNVTGANSTVAVGVDEESDEDYLDRCRDKLASLSAAGPAEIYDFVARTSALNGGANITQTKVIADNVDGTVTVYLAGPSGVVSGGDVALVQAGFDTYAEPLTIESTAVSCTTLTQNVTYTLWVKAAIGLTSGEIQDAVEAALQQAIAARPIGGDIIPPALVGYVYQGWIQATIIEAVAPHGFRAVVSTPATDVAPTVGQKVVLGTVVGTINIIA